MKNISVIGAGRWGTFLAWYAAKHCGAGRLIKHYGGNERSAYGLAHLGDYEATLFSAHSHNRMYGEAFAKHKKFGKLADGHYTLSAVKKISDAEGIDMPIAQALYSAIYEGADIKRSIQSLFERREKSEFE